MLPFILPAHFFVATFSGCPISVTHFSVPFFQMPFLTLPLLQLPIFLVDIISIAPFLLPLFLTFIFCCSFSYPVIFCCQILRLSNFPLPFVYCHFAMHCHPRIQSVLDLADTLYHLGQFALQLQHEPIEILRQLSYEACNSNAD